MREETVGRHPGGEWPAGTAERVLVVNVDEAVFDALEPLLARGRFEVERFPRASSALDLLDAVSFRVVVVGYPLPDIRTQEFLDTVRRPGSPNRGVPLVLVTGEEERERAVDYLGRGANRVVTLEESEGRLEEAVAELLEVPPRREVRMMARLSVELGDGRNQFLCQTENLSVGGMLVSTEAGLHPGMRVRFEFHLGDDHLPTCGVAEVVRRTTPGRERVRGVGMRFVSFEGEGRRRLSDYLRELSGED